MLMAKKIDEARGLEAANGARYLARLETYTREQLAAHYNQLEWVLRAFAGIDNDACLLTWLLTDSTSEVVGRSVSLSRN